MKRPLILRWAPLCLKERLYFHLYRHRRSQFLPLYESTSLHFAPRVSMRLMPSDKGHSVIAFAGIYESALTQRIVRAATGGGLLIDVGANFGYYSLLWAALGGTHRALAFEASPRNYAHLESNIQRNGLAAQIDVRKVALGQRPGRFLFDVGPPEESGWGGLSMTGSSDTVEVEVVRLDEELGPATIIRVLKIDMEGADTWVLKGAEKLFAAKKKQTT